MSFIGSYLPSYRAHSRPKRLYTDPPEMSPDRQLLLFFFFFFVVAHCQICNDVFDFNFHNYDKSVDTVCLSYGVCYEPEKIDVFILIDRVVVEDYLQSYGYICLADMGFYKLHRIKVVARYDNGTRIVKLKKKFRTPYPAIPEIKYFNGEVVNYTAFNVSWTLQKPLDGFHYIFKLSSRCFRERNKHFEVQAQSFAFMKSMFKERCRHFYLIYLYTYVYLGDTLVKEQTVPNVLKVKKKINSWKFMRKFLPISKN